MPLFTSYATEAIREGPLIPGSLAFPLGASLELCAMEPAYSQNLWRCLFPKNAYVNRRCPQKCTLIL